MFDCFSVRFVPHFRNKPNFQNDRKSLENRTNMDIILSFLAKPQDKHGITLMHITYLPLNFPGKPGRVRQILFAEIKP